MNRLMIREARINEVLIFWVVDYLFILLYHIMKTKEVLHLIERLKQQDYEKILQGLKERL